MNGGNMGMNGHMNMGMNIKSRLHGPMNGNNFNNFNHHGQMGDEQLLEGLGEEPRLFWKLHDLMKFDLNLKK